MGVLNFIINEIFGQGAIFLALIACIGLIIQKKSVSEIIRGTAMTAMGFFILSTGTGLITGNSIDGIAAAFNTIMPQAAAQTSVDIGAQFGTEIGIVMLLAFAINLLVARFTKLKSVFLTGHMLYWFPFVFIAVRVDTTSRHDIAMMTTNIHGVGDFPFTTWNYAIIRDIKKQMSSAAAGQRFPTGRQFAVFGFQFC